jgi:chaperonin GroES
MQKFTESGLEIPGNSREFKPHTGKILSVGARCKEVKAGMHVMFGRNSGTEITINDETVLIMRESDCLINTQTMTPFANRVLIEPHDTPKIIKGLYIPDNTQEQPQTGVVYSVGAQCEEVEDGKTVLFGKSAGAFIFINKKKYLVLREDDVFSMV